MRNRPPLRVITKMLSNVTVNPDTGCHESNYSVGSHGYAQIGWNEGGRRTAQTGHRVAWYAAFGDIPDHLTVDHICRNRRCINIDHLRLLTNVDNGWANNHTFKTHCPAGHPYSEGNTIMRTNPKTGAPWRECRLCRTARNAARRRAA